MELITLRLAAAPALGEVHGHRGGVPQAAPGRAHPGALAAHAREQRRLLLVGRPPRPGRHAAALPRSVRPHGLRPPPEQPDLGVEPERPGPRRRVLQLFPGPAIRGRRQLRQLPAVDRPLLLRASGDGRRKADRAGRSGRAAFRRGPEDPAALGVVHGLGRHGRTTASRRPRRTLTPSTAAMRYPAIRAARPSGGTSPGPVPSAAESPSNSGCRCHPLRC